MTVTRQAPLSVGLSWQEYWSGSLFPSPGDLPHPGIKPSSSVAPALAGGFFPTDPPGKPIPSPLVATNYDLFSYENFFAYLLLKYY